MQDFIRKHRVVFGVVIFLFIGIPMAFFFGMPTQPAGSGDDNSPPLITVSGKVVTAFEFSSDLGDMMKRVRTQPGNEDLSDELVMDQLEREGILHQLVRSSISGALIGAREEASGLAFTEEYLAEVLKNYSDFRTEDGEFSPAAWNNWITQGKKNGTNWKAIYETISKDKRRQMYLNPILAGSARVLDKDVTEQIEQRYTSVEVKFAKLEAKVNLEEEAIQKQYDAAPERYRSVSTLDAEYVILPITPPAPEKAFDALNRLAAGEEFSALAKELTDLPVDATDEVKWTSLGPDTLKERKPLFDLAVGETSELVYGPGGYFLYILDEERTNEDTGVREVHGRQMFFIAQIDAVERQRIQEIATEIVTAANAEGGSLAAAAADYELVEVKGFTRESEEISGIPVEDTLNFRTGMTPAAEGETAVYRDVTARSNIYVGKVTNEVKGDIPPLEDVREAVVSDAESIHKRQEDYQKQLVVLADKIIAAKVGLDKVNEQFPEVALDVQTSSVLKATETPYINQAFIGTAQVIAAVSDKKPGDVVGPVNSLLGEGYLIELVTLTLPTDEDRAGWAEEEEQLRLNMQRQVQAQVMEDYTNYLYTWALDNNLIEIDSEIYKQVTGKDLNATAAAE